MKLLDYAKIVKRYDHVKHFCTKCAPGRPLFKYVFISENKDIFVNLALEDWLYQNSDFSNKQILLLWRNTAAVVIGRHQNPWLEANVKQSCDSNVTVARRNSGGGAVYHDLDNLNLSFLTSHDSHNRVHNLEIIKRSIEKEWNIVSRINSRSDIVFKSKKISGTASKLSRRGAYHHCTLLVDVNKNVLTSSLHSRKLNIRTNATASKPSETLNLRELDPTINIDRLISVIGLEFLSTAYKDTVVQSKGFHLIIPEEKYFPGISEKIQQFQTWDWVFGRTPKFKLVDSLGPDDTRSSTIDYEIEIESGAIKGIKVNVPPDISVTFSDDDVKHITNSFLEEKFSEKIVNVVKNSLLNLYLGNLKACN